MFKGYFPSGFYGCECGLTEAVDVHRHLVVRRIVVGGVERREHKLDASVFCKRPPTWKAVFPDSIQQTDLPFI